MSALAWTPVAFVVTVALWRAWQVLSGLIEWEENGRKITVGGTTAIATIGAFGVLYFVGGGAVVVSGGGPSARGAAAGGGGGGGGTPDTVYFHSDWSTATGSGANAIRDSSKTRPWPAGTFGSGVLEVVSASSLTAWPSTNALRVHCFDGASPFNQCDSGHPDMGDIGATPGYWPLPTEGNSLYTRVYLWVDSSMAQASGASDHPLEDTDGGLDGSQVWNWGIHSSAGGFVWEWVLNDTFPTNRHCPGVDPDAVDAKCGLVADRYVWPAENTLRVEYQIRGLADSTYTAHVRIYDEVGDSLLFDDTRFQDVQGNTTLADSVPKSFANAGSGIASLARVMIGTSAIGSSEVTAAGLTVNTDVLYHWGAFAVCGGDWCGAYPIAGVEN